MRVSTALQMTHWLHYEVEDLNEKLRVGMHEIKMEL